MEETKYLNYQPSPCDKYTNIITPFLGRTSYNVDLHCAAYP